MAHEKKENYFESITAPYQVSEGNMLAKLKAAMVGHIGAQEIDVRKSKGSYMFVPSENRSVLDMNQSLSAKALSYNHPVFDDPEYKELMGLYSNNRLSYSTYHNEDFAKATEVIMNRFVKPGGFDHIFYISGGAKSVEVAVHIAIINKVEKNMQAGKGEIGNAMISLFGDFHGRGLGLRNLTTSVPEKNEFLPTFSTWKTLDPPLSEEEVPGALKKLEELIQEVGPDNLAGFIAEDMIQCGWGDRFIPASFYHGVRKLADQYDFYVIYDAVQTGMYASGMPFAHQALEAASPDIVAGCKKAYTGYVLVKEKIREVKGNAIDSTISINSTWGGHLPDIITWAYVLECIEQDDLVGNIKARGAQMLEGLKGIANKYDEVSNARGVGLMGLSLSAPSGEFLGTVKNQCYKNGLNIFPGTTPAPDGYAIRYRPVLDVTEDEIAKTIEITDQSIGEILKA